MRKTKTCPKCECTKVLRIEWVADATGEGHDGRASLGVRFEGYSVFGNEKLRTVGRLEAVMCSECGYLEYYCTNPKDITPDGKHISWL